MGSDWCCWLIPHPQNIHITAGNEDGLPMGLTLPLERLIGGAYVNGTPKHRVAAEEGCDDYWLSIAPVAQREQAWLCSHHRPLLWFCSLGLLTWAYGLLLLLRGMLGWRVPQTVLDWSIWRGDEAEAPSVQVNS